MALDPYSPCPCGSGKKFKWCCQPIHVQIDKAFRLEADGQHEAALRIMDEVVAENPANPEALGRKAQLLYQNDRAEEAEAALQKAFDINPNYPFGHLLRGLFRYEEGEIPGGLLLLRKAAELYDPGARDHLAQVYALTAECELRLNRPVAARAALKMALHCQPANEQLRQEFNELFGPQSRLPEAARREYTFQSPHPRPSLGNSEGGQAGRRQAWDQALSGVNQGKLHEALRCFEQLTAQDADDAAAWYNLGLARAWLGDNRAGLEALDRYVALEPDEPKAAPAWTLAEVLRCGHGMEEEADYVEHAVLFEIRQIEPLLQLLEQWQVERRVVGVQATEQAASLLTALVLERLPELTPALAAARLPRLGAYLLIVANRLRLWHTSAAALAQVRTELEQRVGPAISYVRTEQRPAGFHDVHAEALAFPVQAADKEESQRRVLEHMQRYFEEVWIHRPLRSLSLIPPVDAAGHAGLRKKLIGVLQFLQDCAVGGHAQSYDFERLRRKLGLLPESPPPSADAVARPRDIAALSAAELAALPNAELADEELEQAFQAALKLDAPDLAGHFARALVSRPLRADRPDRYPWYAHLAQVALADGDADTALNYINEGERVDCEHNEGKHRNDYELRRGQAHARRGAAAEAESVFDRLIARVPSDLRYRGSAAEAMLSAKQGGPARRFAEEGLAKARAKNDRDSEEYFQELVAAARKLEVHGS